MRKEGEKKVIGTAFVLKEFNKGREFNIKIFFFIKIYVRGARGMRMVVGGSNIYFYLLYCFIKLSDDSQYEHQYLPTYFFVVIKFMNSFIPRT